MLDPGDARWRGRAPPHPCASSGSFIDEHAGPGWEEGSPRQRCCGGPAQAGGSARHDPCPGQLPRRCRPGAQAAAVRGKAPLGFLSLQAAERGGKLTHGRTHFKDCPACRGLPALPLALEQTHPNALPVSILQPFCPNPIPVAMPISIHIRTPVPILIPVSVPMPTLSASPPTRIPQHLGVHPDLPSSCGCCQPPGTCQGEMGSTERLQNLIMAK